MPLKLGKSKKTIGKNIATEMREGNLTAKGKEMKQKQAEAIAYSKARESEKKMRKENGDD